MSNNFIHDRRNLKNRKEFPLIDSHNNETLYDQRESYVTHLRKIELKEVLLTAQEFKFLFGK